MAKKKLSEYRAKRDFTKTAEPSGSEIVRPAQHLRFVLELDSLGMVNVIIVPNAYDLSPGMIQRAVPQPGEADFFLIINPANVIPFKRPNMIQIQCRLMTLPIIKRGLWSESA